MMLRKLIFCFAAIVVSVSGRICWKCDANSERECQEMGHFVECTSFNDICFTLVRQNHGAQRVVKKCKQKKACLNNQLQNWLPRSKSQCTFGRISVCRCCCFENYCNLNETCKPTPIQPDASTVCSKLPGEITNGRIVCTNSNRVDSRCQLICKSGSHQLNPNFQFVCLPNGKWDKPVPCCSAMERCPPILLLDLAVVMHVKDAETFTAAFPVTPAFLSRVKFGEDSVRYSIQYYSGNIHTPQFSFRDFMNLTSSEAVQRLENEVTYRNTADGKVNSGAALWHLHNNVFGTPEDRPNVQNAVVLITDENSDDDVKAPATALQDSGVLIYSYFFKTHPQTVVDMQQLIDISQHKPHIFIVSAEGQFERTTKNILNSFLHNLCPAACPSLTEDNI